MTPLEHLQEEIDPQAAAELLRGGDAQLVDVREDYEHAAGRIAGARHIELDQLAEQAPTLDRERPVLFYCRVGSRSALATQAFRAAGYDAHNISGGLLAWVDSGLEIEPEGGSVAPH